MTRHLTAEQAAGRDTSRAAHPRTPPGGRNFLDEDIVLWPRPREVRLPGPVTWAQGLNGRWPEAREEPLITAARQRQRRLELALLAGTGTP